MSNKGSTFMTSEFSVDELEKLAKNHPYFVLPHVALALQKNENLGRLVYRFNINPTLLTTQKSLNAANKLHEKMDERVDEGTQDYADIEILKSTHSSEEKLNQEESLIVSNDTTLKNAYHAGDYWASKGTEVSNELPTMQDLKNLSVDNHTKEETNEEQTAQNEETSLLVQMSFSDWLKHIAQNKKAEKVEEEEQRTLKNKWRQEKLAAAIQEELEDIPDDVFQKAVDSISNEEDIPSESLAQIYAAQHKYDKAINIYKKLILIIPKKKTYFATQIETLSDKKNKI